MENTELNLYVKENNFYINIPKKILDKGSKSIEEYVEAYTEVENLKIIINRYLFDKNSEITNLDILNKIVKIKSKEYTDEIASFLQTDIYNIEEKLMNICVAFKVDIQNLNEMKIGLERSYIKSSEDIENIIDKNYVNKIIDIIKNEEEMYSLNTKSKYGTMSKEYNLKNKEDIVDFNEEEIDGRYSPILVIHRPARYHRGVYLLEENVNIYIKRQPLNALIKQEKLEEKGIDGMGAILYKKLEHNFTNENLQELLAEIYVYSQKNNVKFENIKLSDITSNKVWMTADKLKKEFKELRYYHKNLSQKLREIYDTTGSYYTQIGGKYIFSSREFLRNYKAYKDRDING